MISSNSFDVLIAKLDTLVLSMATGSEVLTHELSSKINHELRSTNLTRDDYGPFINYSALSYTKNLVHDFDGKCNLIIMCWGPDQASKWHGHEGSRCFVKVVEGHLLEQQAPHPKDSHLSNSSEDQISEKIMTSRELKEDDGRIYFIDDSIGIHKVSNLSHDKPAVSLHFYIPAYTKCRLFDDPVDTLANELSKNQFLSSNGEQVDVTFNNII